jgi:single-stranded DNA-binding protein
MGLHQNKVLFTGNIGKLNFYKENTFAMVRFVMNSKWKDKTSGQVNEKQTWVTLKANGHQAKYLQKYANVGDTIRIEGSYDNDDVGSFINVSEVDIIRSKADNVVNHPASHQQSQSAPQPQNQSQPNMQQPPAAAFGEHDYSGYDNGLDNYNPFDEPAPSR